MLTVLTFLWDDPGYRHRHLYAYDPSYVMKLRNMLKRNLTLKHEMVCVTDTPGAIDPSIRPIPLPSQVKELGHCWPKLWAFHEDAWRMFGRRVLMLDLDTVILGNIDGLVDRDEAFVAWSVRDGAPGRFNTSMVLYDPKPFEFVWRQFVQASNFGRCGQPQDPVATAIGDLKSAGYVGEEQDWVSMMVGDLGQTWPRSGGGIESCQPSTSWRPPESARIVFFPGRRSPGMKSLQADHPWIEEHWR